MNADNSVGEEWVRLKNIESRLVVTWRDTDKQLDTESSLLRCADLRRIKRECEKMLGYVPETIVSEDKGVENEKV